MIFGTERSTRFPRHALCLMIILLSPLTASSQSASEALEIELECSSTPDEPLLILRFRNRLGRDVSIFLGAIVGSELRLPFSTSVEVRDQSGMSRFEYSNPSLSALVGRLDPWLVPVSHDVSPGYGWPLSHFVAGTVRLSDKPGPYEALFIVDAAMPPMGVSIPGYPHVVGELRSEWTPITDGCKAAA